MAHRVVREQGFDWHYTTRIPPRAERLAALRDLRVVWSRSMPRHQVLRIQDLLYAHPDTVVDEALEANGYWHGFPDDLPLTPERVARRVEFESNEIRQLGNVPPSDPMVGERLIGEIMFGDYEGVCRDG